MKIHKLLIGCSILMIITLIAGCSTKSNTDIEALIETTVVTDEELDKNTYEVPENLPDNSIASINESLDGNTDPNASEELYSDIIGKVTAIDGTILTINVEDETSINSLKDSSKEMKDSTKNSNSTDTDSNISKQTLNVTSETFINIQTKKETTAASFSDIKVEDMIKYSFTLSETGEKIICDITIMNDVSNETTHAK